MISTDGLSHVRVSMTQRDDATRPTLALFLHSQGNAPHDAPTTYDEMHYVVQLRLQSGVCYDMSSHVSHNDAWIAARTLAAQWNAFLPEYASVHVVTRHVNVHDAMETRVE